MAPDVVITHPLYPDADITGPDEFIAKLADPLLTAYPDLRVRHEALIGRGDHIATRWVIEGTQGHPYFGQLPPTRRRITYLLQEMIEVRDGRIVRMDLTLNVLSVAHQLGLIPIGAVRLAGRIARTTRGRPSCRAPLGRVHAFVKHAGTARRSFARQR